jgi:hypothetical protein
MCQTRNQTSKFFDRAQPTEPHQPGQELIFTNIDEATLKLLAAHQLEITGPPLA